MSQELPDSVKGGFRKRALPLPADYRPMYKIGLICLVLDLASTGGKSSLSRLHFFVWALKSAKNRKFIQDVIDLGGRDDIVTWGVEPALNKALLFGVSEGLFDTRGDKYLLSDKGTQFAKIIKKDSGLFVNEKLFLSKIGKRAVTEGFMDELTSKKLR
jgi:hypothetical protein